MEEKDTKMAITPKGLRLLLIGLIVMVAGYLLMAAVYLLFEEVPQSVLLHLIYEATGEWHWIFLLCHLLSIPGARKKSPHLTIPASPHAYPDNFLKYTVGCLRPLPAKMCR